MKITKVLKTTNKIRKFEDMYHLNIIGNGRITLALLKMIFDNRLDRYINKITVWCREKKVLSKNKLNTVKDNVNEEILRIHLMQKADANVLNSIEEKIQFKTMASLEELVNLGPGSDKDILILTVKYDLDELIYVDRTEKENINPRYSSHLELLESRIKLIIPGVNNSSVRQGGYFRRELLGLLNQVLKERNSIHRLINELSSKTAAGYTRLYNLEHSAIGVKYLAQALSNYNGIIFNMINEVDTTNSILHNFSKLSLDKILSPCENDTIRAKFFLRNNLKRKGINVKQVTLSYLGPHNHAGFIPLETIRVDGKPLTKIMGEKTAHAVVEEITDKVNGFGEEVFLKKGGSDEDTVLGICSTLYSLFNTSGPVVRVSCYEKESDLFSGFPGYFKHGRFFPLKQVLSDLTPESREKLQKANDEQKYINHRIMSAIQNDF